MLGDVLLFLKPMSGMVIFSLLAILVLLVLSALISGSEVAYFSLSPSQLDEVQGSHAPADVKLESLLAKPDNLLATILIANNLVNVAIIVLSSVVVNGLFDFTQINELNTLLIQVVLVTFLILMAGEVLPKVYASTHNLSLARFMSGPLSAMAAVFRPFSRALISMSSLVKNRFKSKSDLTVGHLEHAMEITKDENVKSEETRILEGIVKFGNTDVKQVMTARVDTFAVDVSMAYAELLEEVVDKGFSRIPVYKDSPDEVVGVLYLKDLIPFIKIRNMNWQKESRKNGS